MKNRFGFVSNSSSTSFTCDICGHTESGWDSNGLEDFGFYQCENEHIICQEEAIGDDIESIEDDDIGDCIPEAHCPICRFEAVSNSNAKHYLKKEYGITDQTVFEEIKKVNKRRKVLKDFEYVKYVFEQKGITEDSFLQTIKAKFETYKKFLDYAYDRKEDE